MDDRLTGDVANRTDTQCEDRVVSWVASQSPIARLLWSRVSTPIGRHTACLFWMVLEAPRFEVTRFVKPSAMNTHVETVAVRDVLTWPNAYLLVSHIKSHMLSSAGSSVPLTVCPPARSSP